jgi:hypothetical protein
MTEQELYTLLKTLKLPVAYDHFVDMDELPGIVYREATDNVFYADDVAFYLQNQFEVVLITKYKDVDLETELETLFTQNDIAFEKQEYFNDAERVYFIEYDI